MHCSWCTENIGEMLTTVSKRIISCDEAGIRLYRINHRIIELIVAVFRLSGYRVLSRVRRLQASIGAACHSELTHRLIAFRVLLCFSVQGPNFQNCPKTFSKDLPMSDDLGIPKKFSYPNFQRLSLRFQRTSSFLIFLN